jgi:hypothetical protein
VTTLILEAGPNGCLRRPIVRKSESDLSFLGLESITSVSNTCAHLNWTDHNNAQSYAVFEFVDGPPVFLKFVDAPASSTAVTGLTSNTEYMFQVKSVDSDFRQDANTATSSTTTSSAPTDQLLDTIANTEAVYSVRKLSNTYVGSAIAVRRESDDTVADIGFDDYDLDEGALNAHLSGASGFIET